MSIVTGITGQDQLLRILTPIGGLIVLILVVLAIYLLIPAAPPSWRAALPAAILAGLGIGLLTQLFGLLTPWLVGGLLAFGVIATVFAALIWLNLSYQMLCMGRLGAHQARCGDPARRIADRGNAVRGLGIQATVGTRRHAGGQPLRA